MGSRKVVVKVKEVFFMQRFFLLTEQNDGHVIRFVSLAYKYTCVHTIQHNRIFSVHSSSFNDDKI